MDETPVKAVIHTVDGDSYEMVFASYQAMFEWMEANHGRYTGVFAESMKDDDRGMIISYKSGGLANDNG
jgi:effector-binding domain-containing protein